MLTDKPTTRENLRRWTLLIVLLVMAGACGGSGNETPVAETESTPIAEADSTADTAEAPSSAAVEALLTKYYDAYNNGDAVTVVGMLSDLMRETPAPNLEFWIGTLHEQVTAECAPITTNPSAVRCVETYSDALHGPAGATGRAVYQYFERDDKLLQIHDGSFWIKPGCSAGRCPGDILEVSGIAPTWTYEQIEADLLDWVRQNYPDIATSIEDPRRLHYLANNADDVAAVLPYVEEFVAQGGGPVTAEAAGADIAGMSTLEAVEAMYAALNSHDPDVYEAFFGKPLSDVYEWFWAQGRHYERACEETGNPDEVRCEGQNTDEFYTRAGAVFEIRELWTKIGNELIWSLEWANSSGGWAYRDFEQDLGIWMRQAYPEDAAIAFPADDLVHNGEAAAIAVSHLDEFLEASDEYPRDPDGKDDWTG